ncbi:spore germination protein GerPC [Paenibacillus abyssi]|uniref:Uncharacterized protein n=1 Tax=Paenibacillus abyssi TaxID=1340531 RepID=A0A917D2H1_9BACL|nr:spore germination protein GerPC [Paenibacillus abyssi]GGG09874.1 hypothetical protein GCM10010916_28430 [Paenibacillus abyssi]
MYVDYHAYLRLMEGRIRQLEDKLLLVENESQQLKKALQQIKPVHIENISYKVQELTVQELSGTLNIGLTALSDPEQLEKWLKQKEMDEDKDLHADNLSQSTGKEES